MSSVETILKTFNDKIEANEKRISSTLAELERAKRALDFYEANKSLLENKIKTETEIGRIGEKIATLMKKRKRLRSKLETINKEYKSRWLRDVIRKVNNSKKE